MKPPKEMINSTKLIILHYDANNRTSLFSGNTSSTSLAIISHKNLIKYWLSFYNIVKKRETSQCIILHYLQYFIRDGDECGRTHTFIIVCTLVYSICGCQLVR